MAEKLISKGQQTVPICFSCSYFSIQLQWKIDFSISRFLQQGLLLVETFSLVSRITSPVFLRKLLITICKMYGYIKSITTIKKYVF